MKVKPISRRTPEEARAFRQGYRAGWQSVLRAIEQEGRSTEEARESHQTTSDLLDRLAEESEAPR